MSEESTKDLLEKVALLVEKQLPSDCLYTIFIMREGSEQTLSLVSTAVLEDVEAAFIDYMNKTRLRREVTRELRNTREEKKNTA